MRWHVQIRLPLIDGLSSLSLAKTKDFFNLFFWLLNILPGGLIGLLTKIAKQFWAAFICHLGHI